jgi:hypothetical protein
MTAASAAYLNKALEPTANSVRYAPAVSGGSAPAFGFLPANHISKETCEEQTVCCMMRTDGYWIRSHVVASV